MNTPKDIDTGIDYQEKYRQLSDGELRELLKNRKNYQPKAASAAIQEAIRRGILQSEQDLFAEEYCSQENHSRFLFPHIEKPEQKAKTLNSLYRIFYVAGIIPLVFAGMNYRNNQAIAIASVVVGLSWMYLTFRLSKTKKRLFLSLMQIMFYVVIGFATHSVFSQINSTIMDFAVLIIASLVSIYCLLFARSILKS